MIIFIFNQLIVGIYIGEWKLGLFFFFFPWKTCYFLIDTTCFKEYVLYLKDILRYNPSKDTRHIFSNKSPSNL